MRVREKYPDAAMKELFIESFPQMCFEGNWLQNRLRADKNESISFLAVDIQGHQRGGFCIVLDEGAVVEELENWWTGDGKRNGREQVGIDSSEAQTDRI